jgi:CHAT domain-containing protein
VREFLIPKDIELTQLVKNNRTELLLASRGRQLTIDLLKPDMLVRLKDDSRSTPGRKILKINSQTQLITLQSIGQNSHQADEVPFSQIAGIALPTERPELRQLHQLLIAPIIDLLPTNPLASVIFIPDGVLYEVPFAALKNEQGKYLIDLHTISIAPSLAVLAQTAQLKQRNISTITPSLIVGNPDFKGKHEVLPFSEYEARDIAKLFPSRLLLGNKATESAVKQWLPSARIAHFATHGVPDNENGLDSSIILTPSGSDSGFLTAAKVLNLSLQADLIVLSACDTGRGKITGDGVIGLSRSFITAGANSIIVSLWSVNDGSTSMLMTDFYRQWQGGKSKAQALRTAMLNTKARYPDPYFWSSMSLYGEID